MDLRQILSPVDFSDLSAHALQYASMLSRCGNARLAVAYCVPMTISRTASAAGEVEAAEEIVSLARQMPCDLLVVGSRHRRFFDSTVLGATTARVVRHAPCPVLTVKVRSV